MTTEQELYEALILIHSEFVWLRHMGKIEGYEYTLNVVDKAVARYEHEREAGGK